MNKKVGKLIKKRRRKFDLTQEELANILGVSASAVSCWETDTCFPEKDMVPKLAKVLKIKEDRFYEKEVETFELLEMRKKDEKMQNFLYMTVMFIIVFVLISTASTVLYGFVRNDLLHKTHSSVMPSKNVAFIQEADKNLEIIKKSITTKIDEKDKKELVELLSEISNELNNPKEPQNINNNYQYVLWLKNELKFFEELKTSDTKNDSIYNNLTMAFAKLQDIDNKINNPTNDKEYSFSKQYPDLSIQLSNMVRNYYTEQNNIFIEILVPNYKYLISPGDFLYYVNHQSNINVDYAYLLITRYAMKVGDIHE